MCKTVKNRCLRNERGGERQTATERRTETERQTEKETYYSEPPDKRLPLF